MSEENTRAYARMTMAEVACALRGGVDTLVLFHAHPDGDSVGSGFALRLMLEAMGCRAFCLCADPLPERLTFLAGDLQESLNPSDLPADFSPAQIVTVDTASPAQLGSLYEIYRDKIHLMIDHHGRGEMYADGWIAPDRAAAGEMIYELSREWLRTGRLAVIPPRVDQLLYAAISSDTGCFRYSNATSATHRAAADLLAADFDSADLNHRLFGVKSREQISAEQVGMSRLHTFANGRIGVVDMPYEVKIQNGLRDEHLDTLVEIPRSLSGVEIAAAIRQPGEGPLYRVSMRSSCDVDVAAICATFGGGGHAKAAGCSITCQDGMEAVIAMVVERIEGSRS